MTQSKATIFRPVLVLILVLVALPPVSGQEASGQEDLHPLYLWRTEVGDAGLYLLGSIHMLPEDFYPLPGPVMGAIEESDILLPEVDLANAGQSGGLAMFLDLGMYSDGTTLKDHLPPKTYDRVMETAQRAGLPEEQVALMRPWLLSTTLPVLMPVDDVSWSVDYGMETVISGSFDPGNIVEVEGLNRQLSLLSGLSDKDQVLLLESTLADRDSLGETVAGIVEAWKTGNDGLLEEMLAGGTPPIRDLNRRLISDRNQGIVDRSLEIVDGSDDTYLLLVGTAHFLGEDNIPELLEEAGLEVVRYMSDGTTIGINP